MIYTDEMLSIAVSAMQDKKGIDIVSLNIGDISPVCDAFLIVSGSSRSQVDALLDGVEEAMGRADIPLISREGNSESGWILLDYGDLVIHIFTSEMREFYNLEHTWQDAAQKRY